MRNAPTRRACPRPALVCETTTFLFRVGRREQLIAERRRGWSPNDDEAHAGGLMAAIACLGQPDEGFDRTVAALGIDRPPEVRDRLRTLLLDKLGDWNPFEHRIKSRCGVEALLDKSNS